MDSVVALQSCPSYEHNAVDSAVKACLDGLGGLESLVVPA